MHTEDEARTKWCPFARMTSDTGTFNRCGPSANLECIASDCMAWRWETTTEHAATQMKMVAEGCYKPIPPEGDGWRENNAGCINFDRYQWARKVKTGLGHCGLAGKEGA